MHPAKESESFINVGTEAANGVTNGAANGATNGAANGAAKGVANGATNGSVPTNVVGNKLMKLAGIAVGRSKFIVISGLASVFKQ